MNETHHTIWYCLILSSVTGLNLSTIGQFMSIIWLIIAISLLVIDVYYFYRKKENKE